jgi:hypothetical protein
MKFDELYNKLMTEAETNKSPSVPEIIKTLENALAPFDKPGEQAALEELEAYGQPLKSMSDGDKLTVINYFETRWADVPFIAQMIKDYAFDNYSQKDDWYEEEPQHKGWPGDGSGEDDFADYNQNEADDYYGE